MGLGQGRGRAAGPGQREWRPERASPLTCRVTLGRFQPRKTPPSGAVASQGCWEFKGFAYSKRSRKNGPWRGPRQVRRHCYRHYHRYRNCVHANFLSCTRKAIRAAGPQPWPPGFSQAAPWGGRCRVTRRHCLLLPQNFQDRRDCSPGPLDTCEHAWVLDT